MQPQKAGEKERITKEKDESTKGDLKEGAWILGVDHR